ncbi:MAG: amino acid adenylation domain-containing protein [Bacteroidota bacterium]|nr:amino acid adenylation domain-containing protein [Bacteroidota bacterium]
MSIEDVSILKTFCNRYSLDLSLFLAALTAILKSRYSYEPDECKMNIQVTDDNEDRDISLSLNILLGQNILGIYGEMAKLPQVTNWLKTNNINYDKFDLKISTGDEAHNLGASFKIGNEIEYSFYTDEESPYFTAIQKSTSHFRRLLNAITEQPLAKVAEIELLDSLELRQLNTWANGRYDPILSTPRCLHQFFEQTVFQYPQRSAVLFEDQNITYSTLNIKANKLARYLISQGVGSGDFVGIWLPRTPDMYIGMLGILKAGAAYIPIDPAFPQDRVAFILDDCQATVLLTHSNFTDKTNRLSCPNIQIDKIGDTIDSLSPLNISADECSVSPENTAYAIYTSGTTGTPKGVRISHQAVSNLVRAESDIFQVTPADKVFQGFSIAFDASVEEIWMAFYSGASLFVGTSEIMQSGSQLSKVLDDNKITVFSTVPTLLSMLNVGIPSLRLLILGGEVCPTELVKRWVTPTCRLVNTYGPTETTVIATYADCLPEQKVTIGSPVINYSAYILDANMQLLPAGIAGELCIGGLNLSDGYINLPELTNQKFIVPKFDINPVFPKKLYRSGDLCRYNEQGEIEFLGRIDSQVKLRGFRIELSEIECLLLLYPGVQSVAVTIKEGFNGIGLLVAYLVPSKGVSFDFEEIKKYLKKTLTPYMIPNIFEIIPEMPLMPSGKVNRAKLPEPKSIKDDLGFRNYADCSATEQKILDLWQKLFYPNPVEVNDNFFDLGGHSLFASQMISELRKDPQMQKLSVRDVYTHPTAKQLAAFVDTFNLQTEDSKTEPASSPPARVSKVTYYTVAVLQTLSLLFFYGIAATIAIVPFILKHYFADISYKELIFVCLDGVLLLYPLLLLFSVAFKWLVIGKFKEGSHPLWGFYYFRFWLVKKMVDITPITILAGTSFLAVYYRLMGAKIGKDVYLGSDRLRAFDMVTVGNRSSISKEAHLMGYSVGNGLLKIGRITVGDNCFVGARALLNGNSQMENGSALMELSMLPENTTIPAEETWRGSPAKKCIHTEETWLSLKKIQPKTVHAIARFGYAFSHILALLLIFLYPTVLFVPYSLSIYFINIHWGIGVTLLYILPVSAVYILTFSLGIAAIKWILVGRMKPGNIPIHSLLYIRKWTVDSLMAMSLLMFKSLYATLYLPPWLRLVGAKIGKRAEISTVNHISTDLLKIGKESFLADSVNIGPPMVVNGTMVFRITSIGVRAFVGNSAVLPTGGNVEDGCLIGVLSITPSSPEEAGMKDASWLGSPPMYLPKRQESPQFPEKYTFKPTLGLFILRGLIEFFKIITPFAISSSLLLLFYNYIYHIFEMANYQRVMWEAPVLLLLISASTMIFGVFFKKLLIGKYRPDARPLWTSFVWRNEFINSISENLVYPFFEYMVLGTPLAPVYFRLMGCKIGKRVYMETTEITEFDLVSIGNDSSLNYLCTIQTHLFEDRVMKMSHVNIGNNCTIGSLSVILYDTRMQDDSYLQGLSLIMKGESLPEGTQWQGAPCQLQK